MVTRRILTLALVIVGISATVTLWAIVFGWRPIFRTASYRDLIGEFERAVPEHSRGERSPEWEFQVLLPGKRVVATVQARALMDVVRVRYSDESAARVLYKYVDYSSPMALRTADNLLHLYWAETLFRTDYWLLASDLASRREVARRRVDVHDMPRIQPSTRDK